MLSNPTPHTAALLSQIAELLRATICPDLEEAEWNHLAAAAMHRAEAELHEDALYNTCPGESHHAFPQPAEAGSGSASTDRVPPSQSAVHRAAKAPKARTPTYFRRQRVGGDKPPRSKGKTVAAPPPTAAERPSKAIRKKRPKAQKKKRPVSGYNLFCGAKTKQIQEEHPDMVFTERGRMAAQDWNKLPPDDKEAWKAKAVVVNARTKAAEEARRAAIEEAEGEYDEAVDRDYEEEEGEEEEEDSEDEESGEEEEDE